MPSDSRKLDIAVGAFAILLSAALLFSSWRSLTRALHEIDSFPEHRSYSLGAEGFLHTDVKDVSNIRKRLLDDDFVLMHDYKGHIGRQYNPLFIAGLVLSLVPLKDDPFARSVLFSNVDFLLDIALHTPAGYLVFPYSFDFDQAGETAPWFSAMAQARIGQALMWAYRISGDHRYRRAAESAILALTDEQVAPPLRDG